MKERTVELRGSLGVYLDRAPIAVPRGGLSNARNCRVLRGHVVRRAMGWQPYFDGQLNGPVTLIDQFELRDGTRLTIFGTPTDLYQFDTGAVAYLTPRYETGTATWTIGGVTVTGGGTSWVANVKVGDEIHLGDSGETDPDAVWYPIEEVTDDTHVKISGATFPDNGLALPYTIRQKFVGTLKDIWNTEVFYDAQPEDVDFWYATNGVDDVVRWDGNATQVTRRPALGFKCDWLAQLNGMMIYGNLLESAERKSNVFRSSVIGVPEDVSGDGAAEQNGTDIADHLVAGIPLGDVLVSYGRKSRTLLQFVGPPLYWVLRTVSRNRGVVSGRAIVDRGDHHEFIGQDGAFRFDGVRDEEFGGQVFREVVKKIDLNRLEQTIGFQDLEAAEVLWIVPHTDDGDPETAGPTTAYTEHYLEPVGRNPVPVMIRDLPATAIGEVYRDESLRFDDVVGDFASQDYAWNDRFFQAEFPSKLFGTVAGEVMELGFDDSKAGEPLVAFARFARIPVADGIYRGLVRELEAVVENLPAATYPLTVRIYAADRAEGGSTLEATVLTDLTGVGERWKRPRVLARFIDVEARTDEELQGWSLSGIRLLTRDSGRR